MDKEITIDEILELLESAVTQDEVEEIILIYHRALDITTIGARFGVAIAA